MDVEKMDDDQLELLLRLIRGQAEIDVLMGAVVPATPPPTSPKTQQVLAEVERRKGFDLYHRILDNRYAPSAAQGDDPYQIPPSMQLRRMIDYLIVPVAVYRLFSADFEMLKRVGIEQCLWRNLKQAVPKSVRKRFRAQAYTLTERIFDYAPLGTTADEIPEDVFMDRARIVLNEWYGKERVKLTHEVGRKLRLFEADRKTVYAPYAELVLATVFLEEALEQRALHEYWLIENPFARPETPTGFLAKLEAEPRSEEIQNVLMYGQWSPHARRDGFFEGLAIQSEVGIYDHRVLVEPMVMRRSVHEAIRNGERERPAHLGFYQLHFDPPQQYRHVQEEN